MHIEINDRITLREIQQTFADFYPYLQLNFYRKPHKAYDASDEKDLVNAGSTVGELKKTHVSGFIEIVPLQTVAEVEKEFLDRFGLSVQVLRKEKEKWVQTTGLDDFTLKEVNELSRTSQDELVIDEYEEGFEEKPE